MKVCGATWRTQLFENISELGKLRSESIALQRGEYSTRLAMSNLLVYNMTHGDQVMSVVLNRGAPTSVGGFESNDIVRFGDSYNARWHTLSRSTFCDRYRT